MPRRASAKLKPTWIIVLVAAVAVAVGLGLLLSRGGGDPFRTVAELDLRDYLENANSLRGNVYKVHGIIQQSLGYSRQRGRLVSVEVDGSRERDVLPILIPPDLGYLNLQKGQRYIFRLEVGDAGVLQAREMTKG